MSLSEAIAELAPWTHAGDLPGAEWRRYIDTGGQVQRAAPDEVEHAIAGVLGDSSGPDATEDETRVFLLLRVVFDLPERAPVQERDSFKGWVNWPAPAPDGTVSLAWPLHWDQDGPHLVAPYEGFEGPEYAAVEEYRHLLARFPFRPLPHAAGP